MQYSVCVLCVMHCSVCVVCSMCVAFVFVLFVMRAVGTSGCDWTWMVAWVWMQKRVRGCECKKRKPNTCCCPKYNMLLNLINFCPKSSFLAPIPSFEKGSLFLLSTRSGQWEKKCLKRFFGVKKKFLILGFGFFGVNEWPGHFDWTFLFVVVVVVVAVVVVVVVWSSHE